MKKGSKKSGRVYRVVQNEGKISFRVEELWEGGGQRGPFGSKEAAEQFEENVAKEGGFIKDLTLEGVVETEHIFADSFEKNEEGNWLCLEGCSIEINNKELVFTEGQKFTKGEPFLGVDVAEWLDKNS